MICSHLLPLVLLVRVRGGRSTFLGLHFSSSAPHCSISFLFSIPASWAGSRDMPSCSKRSSWLDSVFPPTCLQATHSCCFPESATQVPISVLGTLHESCYFILSTVLSFTNIYSAFPVCERNTVQGMQQ